MNRASPPLRVGFVIDGRLPRAARPWELLFGCSSHSSVAEMRFGWIAQCLAASTDGRIRYALFRPWQSYDAVIFLKSMNAEFHELAQRLRRQGTRVIFDLNVDYFTTASGNFYYRGMAPTPEQNAQARRMAELSDALIADSSHLAGVCAPYHGQVRWISDNVNLQLAPPPRRWTPGAKLVLLWSGEAIKLFELLRIEGVLRKFSSRVRLVLVTNSLAALDRWMEPWKSRFEGLLAAVEHEIVAYRSIPSLLRIYAAGGIFISPRFLDNSYNLGHTEWKIALPMACHRMALGSPLPSYCDVAARSGGAGLRICEDDAAWEAALDDALSGRIDFAGEGEAAHAVIAKYYSTPAVAAAHHEYVAQVCAADR